MRAVRLESPGRLRLAEVAAPDVAGAALVRVRLAGVCGTDVKIVSGAIPVAPGRVLGHELVGTVVAGGDEVVPDGRRVLVDPSVSCGRCAVCHAGRGHLCPHGGLLGRDLDGGFAELVAVAPDRLHPLPDTVPDSDAVLLQVLGTCVHGQRRSALAPGEAAVVLGLGVSGLLHLQLLRARGADPVVAATRSTWKRELALSLGATTVVRPDELADAVAGLPRGGADLVVECVGDPAVLRLAVRCAAYGGSVLAYGTISPSADQVPTYRLYHREVDLVASRAAGPRDYDDAITLAASGAVRLGPLLTARYGLEQASAAVAGCADSGQLKVVLEVAASG